MKRDKQLHLRVSEEELLLWKRLAEGDISGWIRRLIEAEVEKEAPEEPYYEFGACPKGHAFEMEEQSYCSKCGRSYEK